MKTLAVLLALSLTPQLAFAEDIFVIDSRRNIPLADNEPVYKDYYLNAGTGSGLKKDLVVNVVRKVVIRDAAGAATVGEMDVPVAQLKVLAVFGKVTVARDYKTLSRDDHPMLEQTGVMSGDRIELKNSFVDRNKPETKPVVSTDHDEARAAASVTAPAPVQAPTPVPAAAPAAPPMTDASPSPLTPVATPEPTAQAPAPAMPAAPVAAAAIATAPERR